VVKWTVAVLVASALLVGWVMLGRHSGSAVECGPGTLFTGPTVPAGYVVNGATCD
jgi:hypothetical protein